jgi:SAM-dependent methyltransferase
LQGRVTGRIINPVRLAEVRVKEFLQGFFRRASSPQRDETTERKLGSSSLVEIPAPIDVTRISSQPEFEKYRAQIDAELAARQQAERELAQPYPSFTTSGYCFVCQKRAQFLNSWELAINAGDRLEMNWREHLRCPRCHMNNRMRASIHLLVEIIAPARESRIYATEQSGPLYTYLQKRFPLLEGSEFVQATALMSENSSKKLRHEDLTQLSFPNHSFDVILSFDVLEHIPDYRSAFAECARTLKPGGKMLFSVPFDANSARNQIRARLQKDGTIEHLLPPEYHDDPRNPEGCLCFQHFGWEMLEQMKQAGFSSVCALSYYSREYGYLGDKQIQFLAEK